MFDSWEALPFCQHNHNYKYFIVCFSMFSYRQLPLTFDLSSGTWLGFFTSPPIGDRGNKGWFLLFHIAFLSNCVSSSVWANNRAVFCPCHSNLQLAWRLHWSLLAAWKKKNSHGHSYTVPIASSHRFIVKKRKKWRTQPLAIYKSFVNIVKRRSLQKNGSVGKRLVTV